MRRDEERIIVALCVWLIPETDVAAAGPRRVLAVIRNCQPTPQERMRPALPRQLGIHRYERGRNSTVACTLLELGGTRRSGVQGLLRLCGRGSVALIEADSAATLSSTTAPWLPWLRFSMTPIVPVEESSAIAGEAVAYRDSVS
jgi:hypothetical protein